MEEGQDAAAGVESGGPEGGAVPGLALPDERGIDCKGEDRGDDASSIFPDGPPETSSATPGPSPQDGASPGEGHDTNANGGGGTTDANQASILVRMTGIAALCESRSQEARRAPVAARGPQHTDRESAPTSASSPISSPVRHFSHRPHEGGVVTVTSRYL